MTIEDRMEKLTDEQKIGLLMLTENIRKMDDFAKNYPFRDEWFTESDQYYNIGVDFCMYSYSEDELLDIWYDVERLAKVPNIKFAIGVVEEAFALYFDKERFL